MGCRIADRFWDYWGPQKALKLVYNQVRELNWVCGLADVLLLRIHPELHHHHPPLTHEQMVTPRG